MGCGNESETEHLNFNITEIDIINTSEEFIKDNNKDIRDIQISHSNNKEVPIL